MNLTAAKMAIARTKGREPRVNMVFVIDLFYEEVVATRHVGGRGVGWFSRVVVVGMFLGVF